MPPSHPLKVLQVSASPHPLPRKFRLGIGNEMGSIEALWRSDILVRRCGKAGTSSNRLVAVDGLPPGARSVGDGRVCVGRGVGGIGPRPGWMEEEEEEEEECGREREVEREIGKRGWSIQG